MFAFRNQNHRGGKDWLFHMWYNEVKHNQPASQHAALPQVQGEE